MDATRDAGFSIFGGLDIERSLPALQEHIEKYDQWLAEGNAGAMEYLVRGQERRGDPRLLLPEAKSILCVAVAYPRARVERDDGPRYARYIRGRDYHLELSERLEKLMSRVSANLPTPLRWKVCVDTSAVLERSWAALAGLGWIGKNTLLIHPKQGSYLFLGEVLINQETGMGPAPIADFCGGCRRCLDVCPTQALPRPHELNSNRCISYWTLEKRGALDISQDDRKLMGRWVAGCDLCQEVCPFNTKPSRELVPITGEDATQLTDWIALLRETEDEYKIRVAKSSLNRVKPSQFRRNLAISLANSVDLMDPQIRAQIKVIVSEHIARESDPAALTEWQRCHQVLLGEPESV